MAFRQFNHLNVPEYWEKYFTKYPQGMTILESLFQWINQVDNMVDDYNDLTEHVTNFKEEINNTTNNFSLKLDSFLSKFDDNLTEEVVNTLMEWQTSGFLDVIIDQALQTKMDELRTELATNTTQLNELVKTEFSKPNKTVFHDDFRVLKTSWVSTHTNGTQGELWTVANNQLESPATITSDTLFTNENAFLSDGKVSVVFENPDPTMTTVSWVGLAVKGKTKSDVLGVTISNFINDLNRRLRIYKLTNGANTLIADVPIDSEEYVKDRPLFMEVNIIGLTISVKINGKTYLSRTDPIFTEYASGICGIIASGVETSVKRFSSFTVTEKIFDTIPFDTKEILFIGDSITAGNGVSKAYPVLFSELVASKWKTGITVTNGGISGNTTAEMLVRLKNYLAVGTKYDIVGIHGGTNDSRIDLSVPIDTAIKNITQMVKIIKEHGATPLVSLISPIDKTIVTPSYNSSSYVYIVRLNARIRELCAKEKIRCVDVYGAFNNDTNLLQLDKLHPNDVGAQLIAQTYLDTILGS